MDKVRRIVHPKLRPFHFQIYVLIFICLTRIIQRIIRLSSKHGHLRVTISLPVVQEVSVDREQDTEVTLAAYHPNRIIGSLVILTNL